MPEGPEIKLAADWLERFVGGEIVRGEIVRGEIVESMKEFFPAVVERVGSHGKYLWLECGDVTITIKLQLKGSLGTRRSRPVAVFRFAPPLPELVVNDPLKGAWVRVERGREALDADLAKLGPDPYKTRITPEHYAIFTEPSRRQPVAVALLDQSIIAGIGNYMRAEIIHDAGIPEEAWRSPTLSREHIRALANSTNRVFAEARQGNREHKCYKHPEASSVTLSGRKFYYR